MRQLVKLYFKVKAYLLFQEIIVLKYYKNLRFALVDMFLKIIYAFINPYRVSRKFLQKNNYSLIHTYGETPIALFDMLLKKSMLGANDTFLELGCGRGRLCFFTKLFYKCKVIGVERIPLFVKVLFFIQKIFRITNMQITRQDMLDFDCSKASFIFFYGTCLEGFELNKIVQNLLLTKDDTKILSISTELCNYDDNFKTIQKFAINLPWGKSNAYLQVKSKKN